jgi:hypothetical protein
MTGAGRSLILDEVQHLRHTRSRDRAVVLDAKHSQLRVKSMLSAPERRLLNRSSTLIHK